jgi:Na+/H+ antiporter NhaD/arsenite permease-like protein
VLVQVMASNIGGTATLIGDPPNIMIGTHVEQLSFIDFIVNLGPVAAVTLLVTTLVLYGFYRRSLKPVPDARDRLTGLDPRAELKRDRLFRILAVLGGTIVGFFLHAPLHVEPVVVAMTGATVMLLVAGRELEWALERVEWGTIFFFVGLFVMVGALEERGVIGSVADAFAAVTGGSKTAEALVILWGAAAGSAVVDNIPFTAAMIPVVDELQADGFDDATWWALALGACFGGNATLIAAAANVAAVSALGRTGTRISFLRFLAVGMPVTVVSLLIATAYLLAFQL